MVNTWQFDIHIIYQDSPSRFRTLNHSPIVTNMYVLCITHFPLWFFLTFPLVYYLYKKYKFMRISNAHSLKFPKSPNAHYKCGFGNYAELGLTLLDIIGRIKSFLFDHYKKKKNVSFIPNFVRSICWPKRFWISYFWCQKSKQKEWLGGFLSSGILYEMLNNDGEGGEEKGPD